MSEDEAFVRAIVDRPGDDTARLVYADWLDERDDPRGAYLRAEHAHAAKPTSTAEKKLAKLAKALDAVWVARVSRPPFGACCERVRFDSVSTTSPAALDAFEQLIGVPLPTAYRAFLLNYNGGVPTPAHFPVPGGRAGRLERINLLFPLVDAPTDLSRRVPKNLSEAHDWLYGSPLVGAFPHERRPFLPVAWFGEVTGDAESIAGVKYGCRVLLGIRGPRWGEVHMITRDDFAPGDKTRLLAPSFGAFLATIQQQK